MAEEEDSRNVQSSALGNEDDGDDGGSAFAAHTQSPGSVSAMISESG